MDFNKNEILSRLRHLDKINMKCIAIRAIPKNLLFIGMNLCSVEYRFIFGEFVRLSNNDYSAFWEDGAYHTDELNHSYGMFIAFNKCKKLNALYDKLKDIDQTLIFDFKEKYKSPIFFENN